MNKGTKPFSIGNKELGQKVFVIAEIGNNHNGSVDRAFSLIDACKEIGVDCVKFQMRNLEEVYRKKSLQKDGDDLGVEYVIDLLKKFELTEEEHKKVKYYCDQKDILYLCTPWDELSLQILESIEVPAYKVASADLTNLPLISSICNTNKPLILSTGMSYEEEVKETVQYLNKKKADYALLHCNSTYPAPFHDINLRWMHRMKEIHPWIGYSGHERGIAVSLAAVAMGAVIIERHITLDRNMEGPDHSASLEVEGFASLVNGVREIEDSLGSDKVRNLSQGEMINRENLSKSLVASRSIKKGEVISEDLIDVKSPGLGISPHKLNKLIGKIALRDIDAEGYFFPSDLLDKRVEPKNYSFTRPWGVPVRYHDFKEYDSLINPDIYEFHLSYSDMNLKLEDYLMKKSNNGFVVHAPELFEGSHLMDITTNDEEHLSFSLSETQKVINITRDLKEYFPSTEKPLIVANVGGFSMDSLLSEKEKISLYNNFAKSLDTLDLEGVELIPQTMAPFPWHFGGQRYQNIFIFAEEIAEWCEKLDLRICFDISHSFLACNHFNLDFYNFSKIVSPYTAHLHLGDARGVNGEGLQIEEGDIDFKKLGKILHKGCPEASFIPEIWQGHKDNGSGFWIALDKLQNQYGF